MVIQIHDIDDLARIILAIRTNMLIIEALALEIPFP
jgi:hypothetical protein